VKLGNYDLQLLQPQPLLRVHLPRRRPSNVVMLMRDPQRPHVGTQVASPLQLVAIVTVEYAVKALGGFTVELKP
jgi:hypothetical protein